MPQIMPLSWMMIFFIVMFSLFMIFIYFHFLFNIKLKSSYKLNKKIFNYNMKW